MLEFTVHIAVASIAWVIFRDGLQIAVHPICERLCWYNNLKIYNKNYEMI